MDPLLLLAFPLLLTLPAPCSACQCKLQHPQAYYCNSDIVLVADILGPGNNTALKRSFRVTVTKILKAPRNVPEIHAIYTPKRPSDCGFELTTAPQPQMLITGFLRAGRVNFTKCHLAYAWQKLSKKQKLGFETAYRTGCKCQVLPCFICALGCPRPEVTQCLWKQRDCYYKQWEGRDSLSSMCVPFPAGYCAWADI